MVLTVNLSHVDLPSSFSRSRTYSLSLNPDKPDQRQLNLSLCGSEQQNRVCGSLLGLRGCI